MYFTGEGLNAMALGGLALEVAAIFILAAGTGYSLYEVPASAGFYAAAG